MIPIFYTIILIKSCLVCNVNSQCTRNDSAVIIQTLRRMETLAQSLKLLAATTTTLAPSITTIATTMPATTIAQTQNSAGGKLTWIEKSKKAKEMDMVLVNNKYYYFSDINKKETWKSAYSFCKSNGLYFVEVEGASENEALVTYLNVRYDDTWNSYWIGGKKDVEETWIWIQPDEHPVVYNNWIRSEIQTEQSSPGCGNCNCVSISRATLGKWENVPCSKTFPFICEMPS